MIHGTTGLVTQVLAIVVAVERVVVYLNQLRTRKPKQ
jgi:hypothetical protein